MPKRANLTLSEDKDIIIIGQNEFDSMTNLFGYDSETVNEDSLFISLPKGKWCRIQPGIAFEIVRYNKESADPGYITPLGKGVCDIYAESDDVTVKLTRYHDKDCSYGICHQLNRQVKYGPFKRSNEKLNKITSICYFNHPSDFVDVHSSSSLSDSSTSKIEPHQLMIMNNGMTMFIIDYRSDTYKKFLTSTYWRDIYANDFSYQGNSFHFSNSFIRELEEINVTQCMPADGKISMFVCRTNHGDGQVGSTLVLSDGRFANLNFGNPDNDVMLFKLLCYSYFIIPKNPGGKLVSVDVPSDLFNRRSPTIIGVCDRVITNPLLRFSMYSHDSNNQSLQNALPNTGVQHDYGDRKNIY